MTWNYRVTKKTYDEEVEYTIREVYYDEQGEISGWTERGVGVSGGTLGELQADLLHFIEALEQPVLDLDECVRLWEEARREDG